MTDQEKLNKFFTRFLGGQISQDGQSTFPEWNRKMLREYFSVRPIPFLNSNKDKSRKYWMIYAVIFSTTDKIYVAEYDGKDVIHGYLVDQHKTGWDYFSLIDIKAMGNFEIETDFVPCIFGKIIPVDSSLSDVTI